MATKAIYEVVSEREIGCRQEKLYAHVIDFLSLSRSEVGILLRHFRWNPEMVVEQWFENQEHLRQTLGLFQATRPEIQRNFSCLVSHQKTVCTICLESFSFSAVSNMRATPACGHFFCDPCWRSYIQAAIGDGPGCLSLRCPNPECKCAVGEDMVLSFITCRNDRDKYNRYLLRSYIENNREAKWCPAPGCEFAIFMKEESNENGADEVKCNCSFSFCWKCELEAHQPVNCNTVLKWSKRVKLNGASDSINWILTNSKLCPECKRPIEKNQGCNHMTCSSPCRHEFCWVCLGPWATHKICNRMPHGPSEEGKVAEAKRRRDMAKNSLDAHYYERWATHDQSRLKAQSHLRDTVKTQQDKLSEKMAQPVAQMQFITLGWQQIIECHSILKWSYAYGYHLPEEEKAKRDFIEFLQGEAEARLETLDRCVEKGVHYYLEAEPTPTQSHFNLFSIRLVGLTVVTKRFFDNLVKALEKGMTDVVGRDAQEGNANRGEAEEREEVVID
ncbi:hypothetical protein R1flu_016445 [Riccia fluitans]|uniref:RBR-type E3 ubiquitin transferase n=1 Tax=Riccia fluitans TaxID=41844 RepID=A0ABD1YLV7_9MARC